jgi:predicted nucleotidyltransferase
MNGPNRIDEVLAEYCAGLARQLGRKLHCVILFGSRARGEAREDSDIDVLCVMNGAFDYGQMIERTSELTVRVALAYEVALSRAFVTRADYETRQTPFLCNVRREAVPLCPPRS